jgi:D-amino peptidase
MLKFMVRSDMEGASGIVNYSQAEVGGSEYAEGQRYFLSDLAALLRGLEGAEVHIYDEHFFGRNIPLDAVPPGVKVYYGKPPYRPDWAGGLTGDFDGMILLGLHSKAGTPDAILPHTYEADIEDISVNGMSVGEIGMETLIAGELGVPLSLIVGDNAGCREARNLVPETLCVETKQGFCETGALVFPLKETAVWIEDAARHLVNSAGKASPLPAPKNPAVEIKLFEGLFRRHFSALFPQYIRDGVVNLRGQTLCSVWAEYWRMKLAAQTAMKGER